MPVPLPPPLPRPAPCCCQAEREKQVAIKDLLAQLAADIKERQSEAREAAKALKWVQRAGVV